jgi:hypothetical protein
MLDVHPAHHAANTWREFFTHIATIVLGLCIAVGLEQTVEYFHHRRLVAETREELRQEREENHKHFAEMARFWRESVARIQNNLVVLRYLQQHPATPRDKLPGIPIWNQLNSPFSYAVWDAAQQTGITALMPRQEVNEEDYLYKQLHSIGDKSEKVWFGINAAEQYNLNDSDPTHLSPVQLAEVIKLTENIQTEQYLQGIDMINLTEEHQDFPHSVTYAELAPMRHPLDSQTRELLSTARAITRDRLDAAAKAAAAVKPQAATTPQNK